MAARGTRLLAGAVLLGAALAHGQSAPPTSPFKYAVFGIDRVVLGAGVRVEAGDVGANLGILSLGRNVRVAGGAAAFEIRIAAGATARRLNCLFLQGPSKGFCKNVTVPLSTEAMPLVQVLPGVTEVLVRPHRFSVPVPPGAYGGVRVGRRGSLLLAGGAYDMRMLRLAPSARLLCQTDCQISVDEHVRIGDDAAVRAADIDPVSTLRINVLGSAPGPAFRASARSSITGVVYAPTGTVVLGGEGRYLGSFIGQNVIVRPLAHVRFEP